MRMTDTLYFGKHNTLDLVKTFDTPLYVMDQQKIINNIKTIKEAFLNYFPTGKILYASKACDFTHIYRICNQEGIGCDVVSSGELYSALQAKMPASNIYYHGNSKTVKELQYALENNVGCIVVDNYEEVIRLQKLTSKSQKVMLRITPGVDGHTHDAITTGVLDCKFGVGIYTEECFKVIETLLQSNLDFVGFHYHIGSQLFDEQVFIKVIETVLQFIQYLKEKYNYITRELNIGGGFGVCYTDSDQPLDLDSTFKSIYTTLHTYCESNQLAVPTILIEPGRSIVANAGITLYTVNSVKQPIPTSCYVCIDGGMTDNPRFALYQSQYTAVCANKMHEPHTKVCHLAGHCCESGDLVAKNVLLPQSIQVDDIIAVLTTGAYNYSMSSNYNRFLKPAVVMVNNNEVFTVIKRETLKDLVSLDQ